MMANKVPRQMSLLKYDFIFFKQYFPRDRKNIATTDLGEDGKKLLNCRMSYLLKEISGRLRRYVFVNSL